VRDSRHSTRQEGTAGQWLSEIQQKTGRDLLSLKGQR
jgi:hypothetical protein